MPDVKCVDCGADNHFTGSSLPYIGEMGCVACKAVMDVELTSNQIKVSRHYRNPVADIGEEVWNKLSHIEQTSIQESTWAIGAGASTAGELIVLRVLESVSTRCWEALNGVPPPERQTWFQTLEDLEKNPIFRRYSRGVDYFRDVRNRLAHAAHVSNRLEAESSYLMVLRFITDVEQALASQSEKDSNES